MASTAPVLAPSLPSCRSHCHPIAAKTKGPDDDDVRDNGKGMVFVVVAANGTITFVPVYRCPPPLVNDRYPVADPRRCQSSAAKTEAPDDEDVNNDRRGMVVVMVNVVVIAANAVAVALPRLPTTATTLPSCRCHCCYSVVKTKALDDDDIDDDRQGIVVVVVVVVIAASAATVAFTIPLTFAIAVAVAIAVALVVVIIIAVNRQWPPI